MTLCNQSNRPPHNTKKDDKEHHEMADKDR